MSTRKCTLRHVFAQKMYALQTPCTRIKSAFWKFLGTKVDFWSSQNLCNYLHRFPNRTWPRDPIYNIENPELYWLSARILQICWSDVVHVSHVRPDKGWYRTIVCRVLSVWRYTVVLGVLRGVFRRELVRSVWEICVRVCAGHVRYGGYVTVNNVQVWWCSTVGCVRVWQNVYSCEECLVWAYYSGWIQKVFNAPHLATWTGEKNSRKHWLSTCNSHASNQSINISRQTFVPLISTSKGNLFGHSRLSGCTQFPQIDLLTRFSAKIQPLLSHSWEVSSEGGVHAQNGICPIALDTYSESATFILSQ